jgi:hypothetical protein
VKSLASPELFAPQAALKEESDFKFFQELKI